MQIALTSAGCNVEREKSFPALFRGLEIGHYRPDLIVNDEVVVEIKSVERYDPDFLAQMLTYLRVTRLKVGLIINFNRPRVTEESSGSACREEDLCVYLCVLCVSVARP